MKEELSEGLGGTRAWCVTSEALPPATWAAASSQVLGLGA